MIKAAWTFAFGAIVDVSNAQTQPCGRFGHPMPERIQAMPTIRNMANAAARLLAAVVVAAMVFAVPAPRAHAAEAAEMPQPDGIGYAILAVRAPTGRRHSCQRDLAAGN